MASNPEKTMDDLDLTNDEVKRLGEALKNEEFRKMLVEYAEEISDPENRRKAEEEIRMMENERGMDVQFIHPKPGHVLKTTVDGTKKAFINICQNEKIDTPSSKREAGPDGKSGLMWHIPHSFAPPREDCDKAKEKCQVFDVVFHPDTYRMAQKNNRFLKLVEDTALDGIERQFGVKLDKKNIKRPKMPFKGQPVATVIRERKSDADNKKNTVDSDSILGKMPYPYDNKTSAEKAVSLEQKNKLKSKATNGLNAEKKSEESKFTVPKYTITHRSNLDMSEYRNAPDAKTSTRPNELVIRIDLPLLKSAGELNLDIFERKITLESTVPAAYKLDLTLPFPVNDDEGSAKFDKSKRNLTLTLPVIPEKTPDLPFSHKGDGDNSENYLENGIETSSDLITVIGDESNAQTTEEPSQSQKSNDTEYQMTGSSQVKNKEKVRFPDHVKWRLPDYQISQDTETISIVIKVSSVQEKDVALKFKEHSGLRIEFMSVGDGCFPTYFALTMDFGDSYTISQKHCSVDVSDDNLVVLILKDKACRTLWDSYSTGMDYDSLEAKNFLTESNLKRDLCDLDEESERESEKSGQDTYNLSVLEMQPEKMTIEIKSKEKKPESNGLETPDSPSIEVVHRRPTPPLHSILKQRSVSESSEDHSSLAASTASILSLEEDSLPENDELSSSLNGRRRTVSFNSRVDSTSFKSNESVTCMTPTLKNRRRKQRKREERRTKIREDRRIRKLSAGSEGTSSGDEHLTRESFSDSQYSVSEEDEEKKKNEKLLQRSVSDPGPDMEKEKAEGSSQEDEISEKEGGEENSSAAANNDSNVIDNSEKLDFRTNESGDNSMKHGEEKKVVTWNAKVTKEIQSKLAEAGKVVDKGSEERDDSDDDDDDDCVNGNVGSGSVNGHDSSEKSENDKTNETVDKTNVDTMLSWDDGPKVNGMEHVTQCAFEFSNTVMFDLDD